MLGARLWVGSLLAAITGGVLVFDPFLQPAYPFLLFFCLGLGIICCREILQVLGTERAPQALLSYLGVITLVLSNWAVRIWPVGVDFWFIQLSILTGFVWAVFLYEMARFTRPGGAVERMALTWWILGYLGLLPCFFCQLRWIYPENQAIRGSVCLALAIFVPKCGDIGAFFTGMLLGRNRMSPVISPKKTWEGAVGGLGVATASAVIIDQFAPDAVLGRNLWLEIGFGLSVGLVGMLGDLAESLIKRDCRKKDASDTLPGFGGLLDVVDAVIFAAPLSYLWLSLTARFLP